MLRPRSQCQSRWSTASGRVRGRGPATVSASTSASQHGDQFAAGDDLPDDLVGVAPAFELGKGPVLEGHQPGLHRWGAQLPRNHDRRVRRPEELASPREFQRQGIGVALRSQSKSKSWRQAVIAWFDRSLTRRSPSVGEIAKREWKGSLSGEAGKKLCPV